MVTVVKKKTTTKAANPSPRKKTSVLELPQRLRLKISAYEHKILDASVKQIVDTAVRHDATVEGPTPLPTNISRYTVNRSPFIDKNSREQFEMRVHRRLVDILNPSSKLVESLTNLELPSGVQIDLKML